MILDGSVRSALTFRTDISLIESLTILSILAVQPFDTKGTVAVTCFWEKTAPKMNGKGKKGQLKVSEQSRYNQVESRCNQGKGKKGQQLKVSDQHLTKAC